MDERDVNQRFMDFLEKNKISQTSVASLLNVTRQRVQQWKNKEKQITLKYLMRFAEAYPDLNVRWLLTGLGDEKKDYKQTGTPLVSEDPEKKRQAKDIKAVPYYPDINASAGLDFLTDNGIDISIPIKIPGIDAQAFINVFGDSMYPKYCSGEIIGIKEIGKDMIFYGHAYVIQMINGECYIKYIRKGKNEQYWTLASENPSYEPREFHISKIRRIFIIKAVITKATII